MLIIHFLGLSMGIGTAFAWFFLGISARKLETDQARNLRINTSVLGTMAHIGIALLIISGGYLMTPFWSSLGQMPLLVTKLAFVLVFAAFLGVTSARIKKTSRNASDGLLKQVNVFSSLSLLTGLATVILAVVVFR